MKRFTPASGTLLLLLLSLWGCSDQLPPTGPAASEAPLYDLDAGPQDGRFATVMTRNLYVGTDISKVLQADITNPSAFIQAVSTAHGEAIQSQPVERLNRIADEIAASRPDLVGLQEVSKFLVQIPGDFTVGNPQQANVVQFDFLQILVDALASRGTPYTVGAVVDNADVELPAFNPQLGVLYDVRLIDRDVILVREGVPFSNSRAANFAAAFPLDLGEVQLPFYRGWTSVDARVHGRDVRFINTHLETQEVAPINEAQAQELIAIANGSPLPVILAGDFNSAANESAPASRKTQAYAAILGAEYTDVWASAHPQAEGLTCCHPDDLLGTQAFDQRIDLIFYGIGFFGTGQAIIVGEEPGDQTASGRWPSDHAGVLGQVRVK